MPTPFFTGLLPSLGHYKHSSSKVILLPVRGIAHIHVVFKLCRTLTCAAAVYASHIDRCLQSQPEVLAVVPLCAHNAAAS